MQHCSKYDVHTSTQVLQKSNSYLAEDWCMSVSEGVAEVLSRQQTRGQTVHTQAFGVQQRVREGAHLGPVHVQHAGAQLLPQ